MPDLASLPIELMLWNMLSLRVILNQEDSYYRY